MSATLTETTPLPAQPRGNGLAHLEAPTTDLLDGLSGVYAWFQRHVAAAGYSEHTVRAYNGHVRAFFAWLAQVDLGMDTREVFRDDVRRRHATSNYRRYLLKERKLSPKSVDAHGTSITFMFRGLGLTMPKWEQTAPKHDGRPKSLPKETLRRVFREAEVRGPRDLAIVATMYHAGVRVSELVDLNIGDVILGERSGKVVVRHGKGTGGGKYREVPLTADARTLLRPWHTQRVREAGGDVDAALFTTSKGARRIRQDTVRWLCDQLEEAARVDGGLHPHMFRHTLAVNMLEAGADIVDVATILGQSDVSTTRIYLNKTDDRLLEALEGAVVEH